MRNAAFRRCISLLVVVIILGTGAFSERARAQGDDEPDMGLIYGSWHEILFPAVMRFFVGINAAPDQVLSAMLTVRQESGLDVSFTLDPAQHFSRTSGTSVDLVYDLDLRGNEHPIPFEPLNFMWQIETSDGQVSTAVGEALFEDELRGEWQSAGEPPLILHWTNENLAGRAIREEVMAAYGLLNQKTGRSPLFQFALYEPGQRLCQQVKSPETGKVQTVVISSQGKTEYPCSIDAFRQVYADADVVFLQRDTFGYSELQDLLVTVMVQQGYAALWMDAPVPAWFISGLADLHRLRPEQNALEIVRTAARTDSQFTLEEMAVEPPETAGYQQRALWDAQSYLLVLYLADRYGADAPFVLARTIPDYPDGFTGALQALGSASMGTLWDSWTQWIFSTAADRAVLWTPYTLTTPTPTATPLPPTATATATVTATPTVTHTPTTTFEADQPKPVVVLEVSPTRPRLPTNTPLPPGSLPTVTSPAPVSPPDSDSNDTVLYGGIAALVIVIVGIAGSLGVTLLRRRT